MKRIVPLTALFALSITSPAFAHDPYLIKEGYLKDPQGRSLIKERLYGDGIFSDDPERFQIRSSTGALLAYTEADTHVAYFCPHVKFCLAVPYSQLPSKGFRLDYNSIDWDAAPQKLDLPEHEIEEYKQYLASPDITLAAGNSIPVATA